MGFQAKMVPFKCSAHCQAENWHRIALSMGRAVMELDSLKWGNHNFFARIWWRSWFQNAKPDPPSSQTHLPAEALRSTSNAQRDWWINMTRDRRLNRPLDCPNTQYTHVITCLRMSQHTTRTLSAAIMRRELRQETVHCKQSARTVP